MPEAVYIIRNVARSISTKIRRFNQPGRARQKQFLAGHRVLHNQLLRLSETEFKANEPSILDRVRRGIFHVMTPDGSQIYSDPFGKLLMRKGQEIRELEMPAPASSPSPSPSPTPVPTPSPMPMSVEIEELAAAQERESEPEREREREYPSPAPFLSQPAPASVPASVPAPAPAPAPAPDFSNAYTERKSEISKKGKKIR